MEEEEEMPVEGTEGNINQGRRRKTINMIG